MANLLETYENMVAAANEEVYNEEISKEAEEVENARV